MQPGEAEREAEHLRTVDPVDMVDQVTRRIEGLQARLSRGGDKGNGTLSHIIGADDPRRRAMEVELHNLQNGTLPYTKALAAEITAKKAQHSTVEQTLQAEGDRQQRMTAAAEKRADEMETDEAARRILAQRRRGASA